MLSSSARRAAFSAQLSHVIACSNSTATRTIASRVLSYSRSHQRRASSSKPSNPADGPKGITQGQTVPSGPAQTRASGDKKSSSRANRRKAKETAADYTVKARDDSMQKLPSVPSTHHVEGKEIAASAFFSLHRPISVTNSFPKTITDEAFATIFNPRTRANARPSDVISTLSRTVSKLESTANQEQWDAETDELRAAITAESQHGEVDIRHLDQGPTDSLIPFPQHILSGDYRPFNPPPLPQPMSAESLAAGAEAAAELQNTPQHRTYKAVLTIKESTDANGEVTYMAHSSPLIADVEEPFTSSESSIEESGRAPTTFRERMNIRQERYEESLQRRGEDSAVWAISVKRQRKLKMKKHKYKKLMRRTRNLRRRLDRN